MLYTYKALTKSGEERTGNIDALNEDVAISALQRRDLVVVSVRGEGQGGSIFEKDINIFQHVTTKEVVMLSRQMATLFDAQIPALSIFRLLSEQTENPLLQKTLNEVGDDVQSGMSVSQALAKHPKVFSSFYINMVRAGEETGKMNETLMYLSDYMERTDELLSKTKNALIYPAFVISIFIIVMVLMLVIVIPKIAVIITSSGQELPIYTTAVIALSNFFLHDGLYLLIGIAIAVGLAWYYERQGTFSFDRIKLSLPLFGKLYKQLYTSRIADNMHTMLSSGIPMVKAVEITKSVVDNDVYAGIFDEAIEAIKGGSPLSKAFESHPELPSILVQMTRVGEETGALADILKRLAEFYRREVFATVDTLVTLIEPAMIVLLGLGVGTMLAAVLLPIYNLAGSI